MAFQLSRETATDIAVLHREVEVAEKLLADLKAAAERDIDIRDVFGRRVDHVEMGVPMDSGSRRLFYVPKKLAIVVIEAVIEDHESRLRALNLKAQSELSGEAR